MKFGDYSGELADACQFNVWNIYMGSDYTEKERQSPRLKNNGPLISVMERHSLSRSSQRL